MAGEVLQQQSGRQLQPLANYSCKLDTAQQKYSAFDRELLAAYLAVRHFRFMLEGRDFVIFSDHKPLSLALQRSVGALVSMAAKAVCVRGRIYVKNSARARPG
jgi:hypothetical protein